MALTLTLIIVGMIMLGGLELWLFWTIGEHGERQRRHPAARSLEPGRSPASARREGATATATP